MRGLVRAVWVAATFAAGFVCGQWVQDRREVIIDRYYRAEVGADQAPTNTHIVRPGETLWSISKGYGIQVEELYDLNSDQLSHPDRLGVGTELRISEQRP